jgi:hypothetical protein
MANEQEDKIEKAPGLTRKRKPPRKVGDDLLEEGNRALAQAAGTEKPPVDLDDAAVQEDILTPERIPLPIDVDGVQRMIDIPTEPSLAERRRVLRSIESTWILFWQEYRNVVGVERMTGDFLTDPKNRDFELVILFRDNVRRAFVEIIAMLATWLPDGDGKVPAGRPTPNQLDVGLSDGAYILAARRIFQIRHDEVTRQAKKATAEPASD